MASGIPHKQTGPPAIEKTLAGRFGTRLSGEADQAACVHEIMLLMSFRSSGLRPARAR